MNNWIQKSIFYHIYPLGLCGAPFDNDLTLDAVPRLKKLEGWIEHLKFLGVNAVYIGPLFESTSHGYDTIDYCKVDRRLGTNEDFIELVDLFHENEIKVVVDGVFNHVGRDFPQFIDVKEKGSSSPYCNWFAGLDFNNRSPYNDSFTYAPWNGCYNLVKLNIFNPEVKNQIFNAIDFWVTEFKIDGIRLDAADVIDLNFLKELSYSCRSKYPDLLLLGEVIHGDYSRWANKDALDSVTNYECYKGLYSSLNEKNMFEIAYSFNRQFGNGGLYKDLPLYSFVDNHDVNRLASTVKEVSSLYDIYALLFTMPGVPSIYYGSEWGITGVKANNSDSPLRPELNLAEMIDKNQHKDLTEMIAKLSKIRLNSEALQRGSYNQIHLTNEQFVFSRVTENETIIIAINASAKAISVNITVPCEGSLLVDLLNDGEIYKIDNRKVTLNLKPSFASILKVTNELPKEETIIPATNVNESIPKKTDVNITNDTIKTAASELILKAVNTSDGVYTQLHSSEQVVFSKKTETETIIVAVNNSPKDASITVDVPYENSRLVDLLNKGETYNIYDKKVTLNLKAYWASILRVEKLN